MAPKKEIQAKKKVYLKGGAATPGPPIGTTFSGLAVKGMMIAKKYNELTDGMKGKTIPALVTCYKDGEFEIQLFKEPMAELIKAEIGTKGSGEPNKTKVGKLSQEQLRKLAEYKMDDMNAASVEAAVRMIEGTARSMGVEIEG